MKQALSTEILDASRVQRLLKVGRTFAYHRLGLVATDCDKDTVPQSAVTDWLNTCRTNPTMPELDEPIPLLTEEEVAPLVTVNGKPATVKQIRRFAGHRRLFPIPAFKLSPKIVRFPFGAVEWWLSFLDSPVPVRFRRYTYGAPPRSSTCITHPDRREHGVRLAKKEA